MKTNALVLSSSALAVLTLGLLAEPPKSAPAEPAAAPVPPANGDPQALASAAVQKDIVQVLQAWQEKRIRSHSGFSREEPPIPFSYSFALVNSAPESVSLSPDKVPFEVRRIFSGGQNAAAAAFLYGYYDTAGKSLRLYDADAKAYIAAADHPQMKRGGR